MPSTVSAHPRSRGENSLSCSPLTKTAGSSPLTRGKPGPVELSTKKTRLIPAHAGKTPRIRAHLTAYPAHPRSRGENYQAHATALQAGGSSPLTRGKPRRRRDDHDFPRLIPAHAGKTVTSLCRRRDLPAHPRSRGENMWYNKHMGWSLGSSPLTRGKHFLTCAFTAQIDQILETLELAVSFGSYSVWVACATDAPQDQVRSIGLVLPSSRGAS